MKVLVYGAGAVGGYLGAKLAHQGHDVTLIVRAATAQVIQRQGLSVTEAGQTIRVQPTLVTSVAQAFAQRDEVYDLIILGMKSYDVVSAMDPLVAFCPQPKQIITTQNGIGVERPLIEQFGADRVIAGSFTIPINKETNHQLVATRTDCGFALAPTADGQDVRPWQSLFSDADIKTVRLKNYLAMKASKALLNITANATSAILNRPPATIYKSDLMYDLEIKMIKEALAVMDAAGWKVVDLPGPSISGFVTGVKRLPRFIFKPILTKRVVSGRGDKMPSFYLDLSSGKGKSEVVFHNGAIARLGEEHGVSTPVNQALTDILLQLTREEVDWREYDGRPKRLAARVRKYETGV
ncbi:MAG: 2-dehydropantoate 2-reductase [Chloroflexota bacterium]